MPFPVRDRLLIGDINDAAEVLLGRGPRNITHLLSLLSSVSVSFFSEWRPSLEIPAKEVRKVFAGEEQSEAREGLKQGEEGKVLGVVQMAGEGLRFVRMAVPLRDMETENLLDYLDVCLDFIEKSRAEGTVLVHCFAGVSRSAAVMTAYLMRSEQLSQEDALESLCQSCELVCPNDGFLEQLKMFDNMGFKVDRTSPIYKRFHLKLLAEAYSRGEKIDGSGFGIDPGLPDQADCRADALNDKPKTAFRCKSCRRVVATQENVINHTPGEGEACFSWAKRRSGQPFFRADDIECSSVFIEPLKWMTAVQDGAMEGKLSCIHCQSRLGYFNWSGIQCSCGSWITPAFQLHKSRIDVSSL